MEQTMSKQLFPPDGRWKHTPEKVGDPLKTP